MAPKYAPNLRSRLAPLLLFLQTGFIVICALYAEFDPYAFMFGNTSSKLYSEFQDVNVMVVAGFGFLGTFLVRYGFSGSGFNLLVAVIATQWSIILNGYESWIQSRRILIDMKSLVFAEICTASALISIGTVIGKTNPVQLILIAILEVSGFILNGWLLRTFFEVKPLYCAMQLHTFGAFFGLMLTWVMRRKGSETPFEKEKMDRKTGLFSMFGTLFLWMFWASLNSILVDEGERKLRIILSTYLALAVSAVAAAAVSVFTSPRGRINLDHIQKCSLSGGVAIGVSMSLVHRPWVAMTIGLAAGVISTLSLRYLKGHMLLAFGCHDTCGVLSVHGLPGLLGWLAHLTLQINHMDDCTTAIRFAVFHICTLLITLSLSMSMGVITGLLVKWSFWRPPQDRKCFDDQAFWEFPKLAKKK
ncbi:rh blood group, D antigen [Gadus chalcogrammus]|uniref:rh blood group, D antigen n=1 Tax=Gadus chalcogrammus TaxID=1042646 RepID=UPI0024C431B5|nr:rh blood group, D antigen [Gadus chalcogrammus]XP_056445999.1 rh blood group, D antigen [Gadus chalcogrammus]XP_056446000.1 rh blood group, D antigen [Gadus chalcogrammus]XP_056446001.1 rh blood group, D antigen [Gadus chalcogrammus]XP_056446002.1 rh blood group, D antigen [Gadus chalcogrammus]XP_056446003.1 rh blood group, D antigen [Gadus chalcogrammus]